MTSGLMLCIALYIWRVISLYRRVPLLDTRAGETTVLLEPRTDEPGCERLQWAFGSCLVPQGAVVAEEKHRELFGTHVQIATITYKREPDVLILRAETSPRRVPYFAISSPLLSWIRVDGYRSLESALTTRFSYTGLRLRALMLVRKQVVRFTRVRCNGMKGFSREEIMPIKGNVAGHSYRLDLFDDRAQYSIWFLSVGAGIPMPVLRRMASSFSPAGQDPDLLRSA